MFEGFQGITYPKEIFVIEGGILLSVRVEEEIPC